MSNPLEKLVFYQDGVYGGNNKETTVREVLTAIKKGKYRTNVDYLRDILSKGDRKGYDREKKNLPAVTFGATFHKKRNTNDVKSYTNLLVLDIDDLGNEGNVVAVESFLHKDKYVISCWRSPSNFGLKGIMYLEYKTDFPLEQAAYFHQSAFVEVEKYFESTYGIVLDNSGKDVVRMCFLSYDSRLYYNKNFEKFQVSISPTIKTKTKNRKVLSPSDSAVERDVLYNPKGKNKSQDRKIIGQIIKFLGKRDLSITRNYNDWSNVARTIACCFTFDIGLKYFQALSMQDVKVYDADECRLFLRERYLDTRTQFSLATMLYLANKQGYSGRGVDLNRRKIKDVIKYLDKEKLSITSSYSDRKEIGKTIAQIFEYKLGIKYFKLLNRQNVVNYDELECEIFLKELYLDKYEGYTIEVILRLAKEKGYKKEVKY
ncbi:BT4734/BF3469 family protein [Sphingobacterium sp. WOUb80]|uniref:BT4734/BF3469 family protein n=1 Tax=Sphingobacterium sp. WOUb80 TaxID=3234028 RepID=UPI003CE7D256